MPPALSFSEMPSQGSLVKGKLSSVAIADLAGQEALETLWRCGLSDGRGQLSLEWDRCPYFRSLVLAPCSPPPGLVGTRCRAMHMPGRDEVVPWIGRALITACGSPARQAAGAEVWRKESPASGGSRPDADVPSICTQANPVLMATSW